MFSAWAARLPARCAYCGCLVAHGRLACAVHADLLRLDPHYGGTA